MFTLKRWRGACPDASCKRLWHICQVYIRSPLNPEAECCCDLSTEKGAGFNKDDPVTGVGQGQSCGHTGEGSVADHRVARIEYRKVRSLEQNLLHAASSMPTGCSHSTRLRRVVQTGFGSRLSGESPPRVSCLTVLCSKPPPLGSAERAVPRMSPQASAHRGVFP